MIDGQIVAGELKRIAKLLTGTVLEKPVVVIEGNSVSAEARGDCGKLLLWQDLKYQNDVESKNAFRQLGRDIKGFDRRFGGFASHAAVFVVEEKRIRYFARGGRISIGAATLAEGLRGLGYRVSVRQ